MIKEEIEGILKDNRFGFSKLRIFGFDGNGHAEKIKLNTDPIRVIQRQFNKKNQQLKQQPKRNRDNHIAQSMTFDSHQNPSKERLKETVK